MFINYEKKEEKPLLEQDRYITLQETAEYLGMNDQVVRKWAREGHIKAVRFGERVWRIHTSEIKRFIEVQEQETAEEIAETLRAIEEKGAGGDEA